MSPPGYRCPNQDSPSQDSCVLVRIHIFQAEVIYSIQDSLTPGRTHILFQSRVTNVNQGFDYLNHVIYVNQEVVF